MKKFDLMISETGVAHIVTPVTVEAKTIDEAIAKLDSNRDILKYKREDDLNDLRTLGIDVDMDGVGTDLMEVLTHENNNSSYVQFYSFVDEGKIKTSFDTFKVDNIAYANEHDGHYALISIETALDANIDLKKDAILIKPEMGEFKISKERLDKLNFFKGDYGKE